MKFATRQCFVAIVILLELILPQKGISSTSIRAGLGLILFCYDEWRTFPNTEIKTRERWKGRLSPDPLQRLPTEIQTHGPSVIKPVSMGLRGGGRGSELRQNLGDTTPNEHKGKLMKLPY
jgi:hypothetical protein